MRQPTVYLVLKLVDLIHSIHIHLIAYVVEDAHDRILVFPGVLDDLHIKVLITRNMALFLSGRGFRGGLVHTVQINIY